MPTEALDFINDSKSTVVPPVVASYGDEPFLRRQVLARIRTLVLGDDADEGNLSTFAGAVAKWAEVHDALATRSLFGGSQRLVLVTDADPFVSAHRPQLEKYIDQPKSSGVLVLEVGTWAKSTRLYKLVEKSGVNVECKSLKPAATATWLVRWAKQTHGKRLDRDAADLTCDIVGTEMGLLDQELAKLASLAGDDAEITEQMVIDAVGGWRAKTAWVMLDAAASGHAADALAQLDRLLLAGENPVGVLAQIGSTMRRFAAATRCIEHSGRPLNKPGLRQALSSAGFKPFVLDKAAEQLVQLGRARSGRFYRLLLQADLDLKGDSALDPRTVLERLIVQMSKAAAPAKAATG